MTGTPDRKPKVVLDRLTSGASRTKPNRKPVEQKEVIDALTAGADVTFDHAIFDVVTMTVRPKDSDRVYVVCVKIYADPVEVT